MGNSPSNLKEKQVVIVGGGYAGTALANHLRGKCHLTLIDPKEYMHHCVGSLRAVVEPGYAKKIFIPYKPAFGDSFKRGSVSHIDVKERKVELDSGEEIKYDYLVIATGATGRFPATLQDKTTNVPLPKAVGMYKEMLEKVKSAKDIVIVGGGPAGVELAGEIRTDLPEKKVTLIHSKPGLIDGPFNEMFRKNIYDQLVDLGITLYLDEKVTNLTDILKDGSEKCTVKTDKGTSIEADLVFVCVGISKTNSEAYASTLSENMDDRGCLKVNSFLQVKGLTDVFAIGDCSSADVEAKMAYKAMQHADIVARNIRNLADEKPLQTYKPPGPKIVVPIGRNGGVSQFGSLVLGNFVSRTLKSKDLFTSRIWSDMKQTVPT